MKALRLQEWTTPHVLDSALKQVRANARRSPEEIQHQIRSIDSARSQWTKSLSQQLRSQRYTVQKPVFFQKKKRNGDSRTLVSYSIPDRVVSTALAMTLAPKLTHVLHNRSFAFSPKQSTATALKSVGKWLCHSKRQQSLGGACAMVIDIVDCFGTLPHRLFYEPLTPVLDTASLAVLKKLVLAGQPKGRRSVGIAQGNALSPLLCNLALTPLDRILNADDQKFGAWRYADDLLMASTEKHHVLAGLTRVSAWLAKSGMKIHDQTLRCVSPLAGIDWLGIRLKVIRNQRGKARPKYSINPAKIADLQRRIEEESARSSRGSKKCVVNHKTIAAWVAGYPIAENRDEVLRLLMGKWKHLHGTSNRSTKSKSASK